MHRRRVSFRELSRRTGLAPPTINHYVNGRRRPPQDATIALLARALDVEPSAFYEWRRRRALELVESNPELVEALYRRIDR